MTFSLHVKSVKFLETAHYRYKKISAIFFYPHFNKPLFQHRSSDPQAFRNLAFSVSWHHVDKVWFELLVSSWRSMNSFAA